MSTIDEIVEAQRFTGLTSAPLRKLVRLLYATFAGLQIATLTLEDGRFLLAAAIQMALLAGAIGIVLVFRRGDRGRAMHFWYATAFAAALLAGMSLASAVLWDGLWARLFIVGAIAGALLATLTNFCLGRALYVFVFRVVLPPPCD